MRKKPEVLSSRKYYRQREIQGSIIVLMIITAWASAAAGSAVLFKRSCGSENISGRRVLVAYDSKHGSTALIAEKVGEVLCENGFQADIRPALTVEDLEPYDAIVLGSPLYYANFLPGALMFLERHRTVLAVKDVAVFAVSTSVDNETGMVNEGLSRLVFSSVLSKFPEIQIVEPIGLIPGKYYFREIFPVEIIGLKQAGFDEAGDLLNYDFVRSWTEEIGDLLQEE